MLTDDEKKFVEGSLIAGAMLSSISDAIAMSRLLKKPLGEVAQSIQSATDDVNEYMGVRR